MDGRRKIGNRDLKRIVGGKGKKRNSEIRGQTNIRIKDIKITKSQRHGRINDTKTTKSQIVITGGNEECRR